MPSPAETLRVVAAVIRSGDRYLLCQRPPEKRHGGLWEFPGGKCLDGETDSDALAREVAEELGVHGYALGDFPLLEVRDPGSDFLIVFLPTHLEGEPSAREHVELRWVTFDEMSALPLAPSDRRCAEVLALRGSQNSR